MIGWTAVWNFLFAAILPVTVAWFYSCLYRLLRRRFQFFWCWVTSSAGGVIVTLIEHEWAYACGGITSVAIALTIRWWRRRKKRRTLAVMGNKARARLAAMKQAMRDRAQPRRVYRPQPQGA